MRHECFVARGSPSVAFAPDALPFGVGQRMSGSVMRNGGMGHLEAMATPGMLIYLDAIVGKLHYFPSRWI
jgi:hypothetical protein